MGVFTTAAFTSFKTAVITSMIFGSSRRGHYFYDPAYDFKSKMDISSQKCPFKGLTANGFTICNNHGNRRQKKNWAEVLGALQIIFGDRIKL